MDKKSIKQENNYDVDIKELSFEEEALMWTSYRYCIGRHTYVSSLAYYIAKKYYNLLSENRLEFTASDIRNEIEMHLRFLPGHVSYDGNVSKEDRRPLEDMLEYWSNNNIDSVEKILSIGEIQIYHESYGVGVPHQYRIVSKEPNVREYISQMEIDDLIPWANLASLFDKKHYKKVKFTKNGKEYEIIAFESWTQDTKPIDGNNKYCETIPWKYQKIYVPVDEFAKGTGHTIYIEPNTITSVEDFNATIDSNND
jgi:hypothetical protein